ncbi:hypothetical protein P280DRAFT_474043 [Massarina eburnea CBS 473.64]|uniref:EamA domain-containing protein n=1 Tax=Massarina eburnea CBS 473.64 TaxID=1395130 RepID=A0A6A6RJ56_9PLEO|nr:hypothetical protein P280DRAFT_474043 [Massarina eburnea CBS 473.64]
MGFLSSRKTPDHDTNDELTSEPHIIPAKSGGKPEDLLNVRGPIRAPSPNPSVLSIDDFNDVRLGRNRDYLLVPNGDRGGSRSPTPQPRTFKGKIGLFWTTNKGLALVLISQLFGTLMNVTTRLLEVEGNDGRGYHPFQILFVRMAITAICSTIYMWRAKTEHFPFGLKEVRWLLVARGLTGFFGVFGMYYSLLYLPLADATVITFLAPSLACWACSFLIKEPFTRMEQIAAYVSLFGVVLIARPMTFFSFLSHNDPVPLASGDGDFIPTPANITAGVPHRIASDYGSVTPAQRAAAVGIAMLGVLGSAGAYTTMRWIGMRAHPLLSVNYFAIWCTIVSMVMMFVLPDIGFLLPSNATDWSYLIFLGICGFVMQFLLAAGLQYEKSSRATNMIYCQMLFALAFDKMVFGTTPSILSILGSSLILGSAVYVAVHKEDVKKDVDHGNGEEEYGLMSPYLGAEIDDDDEREIQLRTLR